MTVLGKAFTGLTSLATGTFLILLTTASLRATAIHAQIGNTANAAITLGSAFALFFVALFFALPTARRKLIYATFSAPARMLFGLLFIGFFGIAAAHTGVPALLSLQQEGSYDRIEVTVVERGKLSSRRSCDRKATVVWEVHNRQLCNVPEAIWRDLSPGQRLQLEGFLTDYGFRYERIRRAS